MNLQQTFSILEDFEMEVSKLYGWLAEIYAPDTEAALVFYRMHLEEKAHARLIRFQKRVVRQNPKMFRDLDLDMDALQGPLSLATSLFNARQIPDLKSAVVAAFKIESSAAETHYHTAITGSCEGITHLLSGLSSGDRQHAAALHEFGLKRGYLGSGDAALAQIRTRGTPLSTTVPPSHRPSLTARALLEKTHDPLAH
jgi:hypothetical protein